MTKAYVIDAVRTPRGRGKPGKGSLSGIHPQELFAQLLAALERRNGLDPSRVDEVYGMDAWDRSFRFWLCVSDDVETRLNSR